MLFASIPYPPTAVAGYQANHWEAVSLINSPCVQRSSSGNLPDRPGLLEDRVVESHPFTREDNAFRESTSEADENATSSQLGEGMQPHDGKRVAIPARSKVGRHQRARVSENAVGAYI